MKTVKKYMLAETLSCLSMKDLIIFNLSTILICIVCAAVFSERPEEEEGGQRAA
ncbi:MAG: hypothetical protein NC344_00230 [Bacteroidales bacterium]|nr:hypothetical protein [Bacteroidales bacterium]MCM1146264.1 hypothetical protein [Bacteroidales bacterium]MCM1205298.1 hypothetical protein [Bacillota bacterium]MCM1509615.1 hypothetical protein [Clostridium sp.]